VLVILLGTHLTSPLGTSNFLTLQFLTEWPFLIIIASHERCKLLLIGFKETAKFLLFTHTIIASHERCKLLLIGFKETTKFLLFSLKTSLISNANLFINTILRSQNGIEICGSHGKFRSSSDQIVNFLLENITVFTINWLAGIKVTRSFVYYFKMIKIRFQF